MLEKTKAHLKKHKTAYLVGAGVVAGVVLGAIVTAVTKQGNAASELGINPGELSKHLSGNLPTAGGLTFAKLAEI